MQFFTLPRALASCYGLAVKFVGFERITTNQRKMHVIRVDEHKIQCRVFTQKLINFRVI
jgi:hypothetical protein